MHGKGLREGFFVFSNGVGDTKGNYSSRAGSREVTGASRFVPRTLLRCAQSMRQDSCKDLTVEIRARMDMSDFRRWWGATLAWCIRIRARVLLRLDFIGYRL